MTVPYKGEVLIALTLLADAGLPGHPNHLLAWGTGGTLDDCRLGWTTY